MRLLKRFYHILQSVLGSLIYGGPARNLKLIGVTGTSGKSTTSTIIYHILKRNGYKVGLISTVGAIAGDKKIDTGLHVTTPDPLQLQKILSEMKKEGMEYVVLETSSHSLEQGRIGLLNFDFAIYTNIKRDHLDYHGTWENYANAKAMLLNKLKHSGVAVINADDEKSYKFLMEYIYNQDLKVKSILYSPSNEIRNLEESAQGLKFQILNTEFSVPILGTYNADNVLAASKVALEMGLKIEDIASSLINFEGITGRMQIMQSEPSLVIVDFAHNTDSLVRSLEAARKLVKENGKLINVFGSAGLRDVEKRTTMGEASGKLADVTVVTSEDPRTEKLYDINSAIIAGAEKSGAKLIQRFTDHDSYLNYLSDAKNLELIDSGNLIYSFDEETVNSRFDAVDFALKIAKPGDVVITEGKGHEQSLCFGTIEYPFTDQEAVKKALEESRA